MRAILCLVLAAASLPAVAQPSGDLGPTPDTIAVRDLPGGRARAPDPLPVPVWAPAAAVANGKLFVFGGFDGRVWHDESWELDPKTGRWKALAPVPRKVMSAGAAAVGGKIVLAGGSVFTDRGHATSETFIYDPAKDAWSQGPPMERARIGLNLVWTGKSLVAIGGTEENGFGAGTVERLRGGRWSEIGSMVVARSGMASAALDGLVYVAGGVDAAPGHDMRRVGDLSIYDPESGSWDTRHSMPTPRHGPGAAAIGGKIYVIGGEPFQGQWASGAVEIYDPASSSWSSAPAMPLPVQGAAVGVVGGRLYIAGGSPDLRQPTGAVQVYETATRTWKISAGSVARWTPPSPAPPPVVAWTPPPNATRPPAVAPAFDFPRNAPPRPDDYALVVGIDYYKSLPHAEFAEGDARAMTSAFQALGVPEENIVTLTGAKATLSELSKYVEEWLPKRVSKDSRVYFYFSGHGAPDVQDGSAYLMPWDADAAFVKSTGFPLEKLYASLGDLPARQVVAILDSCFSGAGGRSVIASGIRPLVTVRLPGSTPPRVSVLAAAEKDEIAGSDPERAHGLFSYYVLEGLSGAAARGDGHETLEELYSYVRKHVILDARRRENREQTPTLLSPNPLMRLY